jgi:hypothetical protein
MTHTSETILLALGFLIAPIAQAALPPPEPKPLPQYEVGILSGVGLNFPSLGSNFVMTTASSQVGFTGGAFAAYHLSPELTIELDAVYAYQAYNLVTTISTVSITTSVAKSVLELPLFIRGWIFSRLGIGVGPYGAFGIGSYTVAGVSEDYPTYQKNRSEFGIAGSIQGRLPVAEEANLLLDVRYLYGLTDLNNDGNPGDSIKDRQLEILAGISFSL